MKVPQMNILFISLGSVIWTFIFANLMYGCIPKKVSICYLRKVKKGSEWPSPCLFTPDPSNTAISRCAGGSSAICAAITSCHYQLPFSCQCHLCCHYQLPFSAICAAITSCHYQLPSVASCPSQLVSANPLLCVWLPVFFLFMVIRLIIFNV